MARWKTKTGKVESGMKNNGEKVTGTKKNTEESTTTGACMLPKTQQEIRESTEKHSQLYSQR